MAVTVDRYDIGDLVTLTATYTDGGTPVDPDTVTCAVKAPDGTTSAPAVTKRSTGIYDAPLTPSQAGTYHYRFDASGTYNAVEESYLWVRDRETA